MICVFLDDERDPGNVSWIDYVNVSKFIVVRNTASFIAALDELDDISNVLYSFDHDIQDFTDDGYELTGLTCVNILIDRFISDNICPNKLIHITHSKNPIGCKNINDTVKSYKEFFLNDAHNRIM